MPKNKHVQYSADFKRDYIAGLAIVLFFAIVIGEIVLAVGIPTYLNRESSMAFEVRRLNMLSDFDVLRQRAPRIKAKGKSAEAEARMIRWTLDHLARYVRTHRDHLSGEEIGRIHGIVKELSTVLTHIERKGAFSRQAVINTNGYLDKLLKKHGVAK